MVNLSSLELFEVGITYRYLKGVVCRGFLLYSAIFCSIERELLHITHDVHTSSVNHP